LFAIDDDYGAIERKSMPIFAAIASKQRVSDPVRQRGTASCPSDWR
jgi:hypothetical protein